VQRFNCAQGVFIDGVMMIEIVLNQHADALEFGEIASEQSSFLHQPQGGRDGSRLSQQIEKTAPRLGRRANVGIDSRQISADVVRKWGREAGAVGLTKSHSFKRQ